MADPTTDRARGDDEGTIELTEEAKGLVIPWRGGPAVPAWPELSAPKTFGNLKLAIPRAMQELERTPGAMSRDARERHHRVAQWRSVDEIDLELAACAWAAFRRANAGLDTITRLFVAAKGLAFALEALVMSMELDLDIDRGKWPAELRDGLSPISGHAKDAALAGLRDGTLAASDKSLASLRALAAAAPKEAWDDLASKARALLSKATPAGAAAIAFVVCEEADVVEAAARAPIAQGEAAVWDHATWLLLASLRDATLATELARARAVGPGADAFAATTIARLGPAAGSVLAAAAGRDDVGWVPWLSMVRTPASFRALLPFLSHKGVGKEVHKTLTAHPEVTAKAIAPVLAAARHADRAAAEVLASSVGAPSSKPREAIAAADASRVPDVLRAPPWLAKKKKGAAKAIALTPFEAPIASDPREGELEQWKEYDAWGLAAAAHAKAVERPRDVWLAKVEEDKVRRGWGVRPIDLSLMHVGPEDLAVQAWNELDDERRAYYPNHWYGMSILAAIARRGPAFVPGLLALVRKRPGGADRAPIEAIAKVLLGYDGSAIADAWLEVALSGKKAKAAADAWAKRRPETTARAAIPRALAPKPSAEAIALLRTLVGAGLQGAVARVAAEYAQASGVDVAAALDAVVGSDPLAFFPAKLPKLPDFVVPSAMPPIVLRAGGALPDDAVIALATMLAFSPADAPYAGLAIARDACTPESLREWAWALFERWMTVASPPKEMWILHALGHLGDDEIVRRLGPKVRAWPGERAAARAQEATTTLALLGTDLALMVLSDLAENARFASLQEAARRRILAVAEARGLSTDDLSDRLVPDLGLDERGELALDFGARAFTVRLDEHLEARVFDAEGKALAALPKPKKDDDAPKAKAATDRLKALKKDLTAVARSRLGRLEGAMIARTRWSAEDFAAFFVGKPIVRQLARRLVWIAHPHEGDARVLLRVDQDGSLANADDDALALAPGRAVSVAHALELSEAERARWAQVLADYALVQPFPQLARETYDAAALAANVGRSLPAPKLVFGLEKRGWQRGAASDGGSFSDHERVFRQSPWAARVSYSGAVAMGYIEEKESLEIESIELLRDGKAVPAKDADPIVVSEVARDLASVL